MKQVAFVPVSGPWNAPINSVSISAGYTMTRDPPLDPYHGKTTGTRYSSAKVFTQKGTASKVDGWREPTLFRGYVFRVTPKDGTFNYDCFISGNGGKHAGSHYLSNSNAVWAGMQGSGRYPIDNGSENISLQKAKASLDKAELQLGVALAELTTTIAMLTKALTDLRKYLSFALKFLNRASSYRKHIVQMVMRTAATRSGRRKIAQAIGKEAANRWLEYQYGWKPLMSDIYAIAGLIDEQIQRKKYITGKADHRSGVSPTYTFPRINNGMMNVIPRVMSGAYTRLDWEVSNSAYRTFNRLGLTNLLEIGWELIPFSFVIDWVAPIGDYLGSLAAGWGLTYKGGSITKYTTADIDVAWTQYPYIKGSPIQYNLRSVSWFRYPVSHAMLDTVVYVKNPISVTRAVTALALLTQLISKKG